MNKNKQLVTYIVMDCGFVDLQNSVVDLSFCRRLIFSNSVKITM